MTDRTTPPTPSPAAILLDIEGTTTPIDFVYLALFPYAERALEAFLAECWHEEAVQRDVAEVRAQAKRDVDNGFDESPQPLGADEGDEAAQRESVVANLRWQMEQDRKTTGLKSLQGKIWRSGYLAGELRGQVYDDVYEALVVWLEEGVPVYIYSSGSVEAQQLLFRHSTRGDLTLYLSGYYDTTTGPKRSPTSYELIAESIGVEAEQILFLTDNLDEARAAIEAGMQSAVVMRPGNAPLPEHTLRVVESFDEVR